MNRFFLRTWVRANLAILGSLLFGYAAYALIHFLHRMVQAHTHLGVTLIMLEFMWGLSTTLWILSHSTFRSDPKLPTEISEGHE